MNRGPGNIKLGCRSTSCVKTTCDASSSQCCWVVRSWQLMGQLSSVDPTSPTACCSMSGVTCSGSAVTSINWAQRGLCGHMPPDIGNLTNLTSLYVIFTYSKLPWLKWFAINFTIHWKFDEFASAVILII